MIQQGDVGTLATGAHVCCPEVQATAHLQRTWAVQKCAGFADFEDSKESRFSVQSPYFQMLTTN